MTCLAQVSEQAVVMNLSNLKAIIKSERLYTEIRLFPAVNYDAGGPVIKRRSMYHFYEKARYN